MPMKWLHGANPYVHNYFGRLRIGPNATPVQIGAQRKKLVQKIESGQEIVLAGQRLDQHTVSEAANMLYEPASLGEELLLVHPQRTQKDHEWKKLAAHVQCLAVFPIPECLPPLLHPLAVFWFIPAPSVEAVELPPWEAFGLVEPNDEADTALDIIFDK